MKIRCPDLYPRKKHTMYTERVATYLRQNVGIDPAILAADLGLTPRFIISYQRKLGLRPFTTGNPNSRVRAQRVGLVTLRANR